MLFKNILDHSAVITAHFPYVKTSFSRQIFEKRPKIKEIQDFYIFLGSAAWPKALDLVALHYICSLHHKLYESQPRNGAPMKTSCFADDPVTSTAATELKWFFEAGFKTKMLSKYVLDHS